MSQGHRRSDIGLQIFEIWSYEWLCNCYIQARHSPPGARFFILSLGTIKRKIKNKVMKIKYLLIVRNNRTKIISYHSHDPMVTLSQTYPDLLENGPLLLTLCFGSMSDGTLYKLNESCFFTYKRTCFVWFL